jgi:hypothetical protein
MLADKIEAIDRTPLAALDALARAVWQDFGAGKLTDAEASTLTEAIEARRRALRRPVQAHSPLKLAWRGKEQNERQRQTSRARPHLHQGRLATAIVVHASSCSASRGRSHTTAPDHASVAAGWPTAVRSRRSSLQRSRPRKSLSCASLQMSTGTGVGVPDPSMRSPPGQGYAGAPCRTPFATPSGSGSSRSQSGAEPGTAIYPTSCASYPVHGSHGSSTPVRRAIATGEGARRCTPRIH